MECTTKTPAELYDEEIPKALKNASRKLCGKLIKHAVLNPEDKRAAIYNAFDRNPDDKKMSYDDFLKAYGLHSGHLTSNAFEEHRRVHSFAEGIVDASRRQALRDVSVTVAAKLASVRDAIYGINSDYSESRVFFGGVKKAVESLFKKITKDKNIPLSKVKAITGEISKLYKEAIDNKEELGKTLSESMDNLDVDLNAPVIPTPEELDKVIRDFGEAFDE